MNNNRKKASYGKMTKMRGGDYMEPNKELQFGGLKRDPDKETYYGGPNTKAGRIAKRADNKAGRIESRKAGASAKQTMKAAGESGKSARLTGRAVKKSMKAETTHSRTNPTIGEKAAKAQNIRDKFATKKENLAAKEEGKSRVQAARKMKKGGPKKAMAGAAVQAGGAALQGIGKLTDAIAGRETKFGKIAGTVGQTAGAIGGMAGGIPGNPVGNAMNAIPTPGGADAAAQPNATQQPDPNAAANNSVENAANQPMRRGGKKRKKYQEGGGKMTSMKKKDAPQLAMSRDTRDWTEKELGVKNPSRAITKKEKDRRDSYRQDRYIKMPLSVKNKKMQTGGAKPDYLDMDKDGNKTESMKSALKDRRSKARDGGKKKR